DLGIYFTVGMGYKSEGDDLNQFDPDCMKRDGYQWKYNGALDSKVVDIPTPIAVGGMAGIRYQFGKIKPKTVPEKPIDKPVDVPDTNIVVDVPVKDTIPNVVVVEDVPEKDTVPVVVDVPKQDTVPTVVVTEPEKPKEDVTVVVKKFTRVNVTFGFNESYIKSRPDLARMLDEISEVMNEYPETKLSVTGHTCNIGSLDQNMRLGQKRAEAFKAELVKRGVNSDRISCDSKAYLEPLFPNTTEANREKNRRVEFTLTEK
ncbi:MAG: OmpA family protein, partial [Bacteroidales bacterium]|nr:OmpA family protein [Bacteroidales bacterium]